MTIQTPAPEAFEQRLAATLAAEATTVSPPADGRERIHARIAHRRRARRTTWTAAAAAVVLIAGTVGIVLRSSDTDSAPYVDVGTDGSGEPAPIRTPDAMEADWDHPRLLVPDDSQWRVGEYTPWSRYSVDAVVEDVDGPRHVTLTVESTGSLDIVAGTWPGERRGEVDGGAAVLTANPSSSTILWHPSPGLVARLIDTTEADAEMAALDDRYQQAVTEWLESGGIGDPPAPSFPSPGTGPLPVDDGTTDRLERMAADLVPVDRATWLRAIDADGVAFLTGSGPTGPVALPLSSDADGGSPRVALPDGAGGTGPRFTPNLAATTYEFEVPGFPEGTFVLDVAFHRPAPNGLSDWEPVQIETQGPFGGEGDPYTPIFTPATVRGGAGELQHYPITTLERTDPSHTRSLKWISDGYTWLLRFGGAASSDDAIAFANSLIVPGEAQWESLVFPTSPPPGEKVLALEAEWLRVTGQAEPCSFGEVCD